MAWFSFTDASGEIFAFRLADDVKISEARAILSGTISDRIHVAGTIAKAETDGNIGWSYRLDPDSIFFFEFAVEVSDSTMRLIEDDLAAVGGAFLPGNHWTGWSSELVSELNVIRGGVKPEAIDGTISDDLVFGNDGDDRVSGLSGNDHLAGQTGNDRLRGGAGHDKLDGGEGNDWLRGGSGNDVLEGGQGHDRLIGGSGTDLFVTAIPGHGDVTRIADFTAGEHLQLDRAILGALNDMDGNGRINRTDLALSFRLRDDVLVLRVPDGGQIVFAGAAGLALAGDDFWLVG